MPQACYTAQSYSTDKAPAAPVPVQIIKAKKVFISNAGVDGLALAAFERLGEPHQPYNQFYAAIKSWGRYELVSAPAEADLVFEIRFGAPLTGSDKMNTYTPQCGVTILDARTHFTLWTLAEPVEGAFRKTTFLKNLNQAMDRVMNDRKAMGGEPSVGIPEVHKQAPNVDRHCERVCGRNPPAASSSRILQVY